MRDFVNEIYTVWVDEKPNQLAAALAYYGIFSFAPVIYLAVRIAGIFLNQFDVASQMYLKMEKLLGPETAALARDLVVKISESNSGASVLASLISFLALAFAASGLFFQLQYALNKVWMAPLPEKGKTKVFIRKQVFSFVMVISVGLLLILATMINVIMAWFGKVLDVILGFGIPETLLTGISTLGLITISFALIYKVIPDVPIAWRDVWPGAVTAALMVMLAGTLATLYFSIAEVRSAFEAAGSFAVLIMAFYYIAEIFLLGAVITRVYKVWYGSGRPDPESAAQSLITTP